MKTKAAQLVKTIRDKISFYVNQRTRFFSNSREAKLRMFALVALSQKATIMGVKKDAYVFGGFYTPRRDCCLGSLDFEEHLRNL